jgi:hypothetical protein
MEKLWLNKVSRTTHQHDIGSSQKSQSVPTRVAQRSNNSTIQPAPLATSSTTAHGVQVTTKAERGRPKGSISTTRLENRPRRLGRPPGTGLSAKSKITCQCRWTSATKAPIGRPRKLPRAILDDPQPEKRPVGRPRKLQVAPAPAVSVNFRPLVCSFSLFLFL